MSKEEEQLRAEQAQKAQEALNSIQHMKQAAHRRSAPPLLFGAIIAALAGSLVTFAVADTRELQILSIAMIAVVIVSQVRKNKVKAGQSPIRLTVLGLVVLIPLYFVMIVVGQLLSQYLGVLGAGFMAGAIFASVVFILNYFENKWHLNKGKQGENS